MKIRPILFIVPLILLALALAGGSNLLLRLFFLSVLVLLISYLWTRFGIRGIGVQVRESSTHCQVGEWFEEEVTVFNNSKIPKLLLKLEENTDLPGYNNISTLNLSPGSCHCLQTNVYCQRRGRYSLGSMTVTATDPFGLFSQHRNLGEPHYILIYPATLPLPFFKSLSLSGFEHGSSQRSISRISPNASSVREFIAGDSLNHIHWRSTAHTGNLMVKLFDADRSSSGSKSVWVIADMHQASHLGEGNESTEEYGITIAASLLKKYLDDGMRVGLAASGNKSYLFPPDEGEQHLWRMLEALALMKASGNVSIDHLISSVMEQFRNDSTVIIITPSATEQVVSAIRQLQNRGNSVVAVLLDAASFGDEDFIERLRVGAVRVNYTNTARILTSAGIQAYIVRKGVDLARALDSRVSFSRTRFV